MTAATNPAREREPINAWDKFLELVKSRVSINTYTTWFQPTRLNRADGDNLYIQIPSAVFRQVLTRTYGDIVKAVFHQQGTPNLKVHYVCTEEEAAPAVAVAPPKQSKPDFLTKEHQLKSRQTFESFVLGKSQEIAPSAAPVGAYEPLKVLNPP